MADQSPPRDRGGRALRVAALVASTFTVLAAAILFSIVKRYIGFELGLLMLVALVGLYFGFGVLIAVHRFVGKLQ